MACKRVEPTISRLLFAWCESLPEAQRAGDAMRAAFAAHNLPSDLLLTPIAGPAAKVLA